MAENKIVLFPNNDFGLIRRIKIKIEGKKNRIVMWFERLKMEKKRERERNISYLLSFQSIKK